MTRKNILLLAIVPMALTFASCDKENATEIKGGTAVNFTTGIDTRTSASGDQWLTSDEVGIFMVTKDGTLPTNIAGGADNRLYKPATAAATSSLAPATADQTIYYPQTGNVDFIAYYPRRTTPANDPYTYKVSLSAQSNPAAIDLLWAKNTNVTKGSGTVAFTFAHKLSKLTIDVIAGAGFAAGDISALTAANISIQGMPATADFALATGALTAEVLGNISPLKAATANSGAAATFSAIVVPQPANTAGRSVIFTVGGAAYTWDIPATAAFEAGKNHAYTITVNKTAVTAGPATITDWAAGTGDTGTATEIRIGDYYYSDRTSSSTFDDGKTCIGIVFWLDPANPGHGKIVSLQEANDPAGGAYGLMWSTKYVDTDATSTTDGTANMTAIKTIADWEMKYPAFKWCADRGTGWYLPAKEELKALYAGYCGKRYEEINDWGDYTDMPDYNTQPSIDARAAFNAKLVAAGGTAFSVNGYLSSTQISDRAYHIRFEKGSIGFKIITSSLAVRAIFAF